MNELDGTLIMLALQLMLLTDGEPRRLCIDRNRLDWDMHANRLFWKRSLKNATGCRRRRWSGLWLCLRRHW